MADLGKRGTSGSSDWTTERDYWQNNYRTRPYATADRGFEHYEPGYRYGHEAATKYRGRNWNDVEPELRSGWDRYEHRGASESTWENIKDSVRDAWNRVTGDEHETHRTHGTTGDSRSTI